MDEIIAGFNLVLLGKTGAGKSAAGNTILGQEAFESKKCARSVTNVVTKESTTVFGVPVTVYDTPGFFDTEVKEQEIQSNYQNLIQTCEFGPCVFLLVIKADRFTEEERKTVEKIEKLLGEKRLKKTWILFTRGDELEEENMTIQEFINSTEALKKFVQKYEQRYHVFNNKKRGHTGQVQTLFIKLLASFKTMVKGVRLNPLKRKSPKKVEQPTPADSLSSRRIVLLGKSGFGKSAAGNTILGQRVFRSVRSTSSVTRKCSVKHATVSGRSVSVVDTPGFFDTEMKPEELMMEIAKSVYISSPGPHAFLIVLRIDDRFTEQEQQILQMIEMMFGQDVLKYSIILFTRGDQLKGQSIEELIKENSALRDLVDHCGGRFHVFNNKDQRNREQVNDLLQKIDTMIEKNGGGHYSNQMFEDAHRFRREEEEQKQREEEERQREEEERKLLEEQQRQREKEERKQLEEKQRQEEIERVRKETEERIRAEFESERSELERVKAERQRDEEVRKQQEEKQTQEEIERVRKETEERIRAEYETKQKRELEKHEALIQGENNETKEEQQRQDEIDSDKTTSALKVEQKKMLETSSGFRNFFSKYQKYFYAAAIVIGGTVVVGAVVAGAVICSAVIGGAAGGAVVGGVGGAVAGGLFCGVAKKRFTADTTDS